MRVCVVDDHEIVCEGLRLALPSESTIEVVGQAASGAEAVRLVRRALPDVVVMDYRLPDMPGDELCAAIRQAYPSTSVVIHTTYLSEDVVQRAFDAGAAAFVTKAAGIGELRRVLGEIARSGAARLAGGPSATVRHLYDAAGAPSSTTVRLSPQQQRVLELAVEGLTYMQISARLHVTEATIGFHIRRLKDRLGVSTKAELIAVAIRSALVAPGSDAPGG